MPDPNAIREAILYIIRSGCQLKPDGLRALRELPGNLDPLEVVREAVDKALKEGRIFIGGEDIKALGPRHEADREEAHGALGLGKGARRGLAEEVEAEVEVIMDPTGDAGSEGSINDFLDYFKDRFKRLSNLLRQRLDARDALSVSEALRVRQNTEVKLIGMVREKREGDGKVIAILEDDKGLATIIFTPRASREAYERARRLMADQVVCIRAVKVGRDAFIARELIMPSLPERKRAIKATEEPLYAVLISDIHFGSKSFMLDAFKRFILWLNGGLGNRGLREIAGSVKYLIIAGDLVDGVGVYPGQEADLAIADIHAQYEGLMAILSNVPEHVEIIISPGNHDACRRALPQPAIPKEYAAPLYNDDRVVMLGNPCMVALHGVKFLVYHGNSFDDMVSAVPGLSFSKPVELMRLLLEARHLAPIYGLKTPIAPTPRDMLVIERIPDVFHTGHIHVSATGIHKGVVLINSGAWQLQTEYQRSRGIVPTPGKAVLVRLSDLSTLELDFTQPYLMP